MVLSGGLPRLWAPLTLSKICFGRAKVAGLACAKTVGFGFSCALCLLILSVFVLDCVIVQVVYNFAAPSLLSSPSLLQVIYGSLIYSGLVSATISHGFCAWFS